MTGPLEVLAAFFSPKFEAFATEDIERMPEVVNVEMGKE